MGKQTKTSSNPRSQVNTTSNSQKQNKTLESSTMGEDITSLEGRIVEKILSKLRPASESTSSSDLLEPALTLGHPTLYSNEDCSMTSLIDELSFLLTEAFNIDAINPQRKVFKLSQKVGEILTSSTILSSPNEAGGSKLASDFWDEEVDVKDILNLEYNQSLPMKFHPKFRNFQTLINCELKPTLPKDVMSTSFAFPSLDKKLSVDFYYSREQLQRLIIIFSALCEITDNSVYCNHLSVRNMLALLRKHIQCLLTVEANHFGLIVRKIRSELLKNASCKDKNAIKRFIYSPLHVSQFFGKYVLTLQKRIQKEGPSFCIQFKSKPKLVIPKLPTVFNGNPGVFPYIIALNAYNSINCTKETDKPVILKSLLPHALSENMIDHCGRAADYKCLLNWFVRYSKEDGDFMTQRRAFIQRRQKSKETVTQFGEALVALKDKCQYGESGMELLRDQFIFGLENKKVQEFLMSQSFWSFQQCLKYAAHGHISKTMVLPKLELDAVDHKGKKRRLSISDETPSKKCHSETTGIFTKAVNSEPTASRTKKNGSQTPPVNIENAMVTIPSENVDELLFEEFSTFNEVTHNPSVWESTFDLGNPYKFEIFCPWTGLQLR